MSVALGVVYFCYYVAIGVLMPYWALYAAHLGLAPSAIGVVAAAPMLTKIVAPNLWALLADRGGRHLLAVRAGALLAALAALLLPGAGQFSTLLAATLLFSFFWNAILPQIEVITLDRLAQDGRSAAYGRVRLWGSIGFIAAAAGLGDFLAGPQIDRAPLVLALAVALAGSGRKGVSVASVTLRANTRSYWWCQASLWVAPGSGPVPSAMASGCAGVSIATIVSSWAKAAPAQSRLLAAASRHQRRMRPGPRKGVVFAIMS